MMAFLYRSLHSHPTAKVAALVMGFYVYSFVNDPSVDATFRVGLIILSSIGVQLVLFFPPIGVKNEDV